MEMNGGPGVVGDGFGGAGVVGDGFGGAGAVGDVTGDGGAIVVVGYKNLVFAPEADSAYR